MFSWISKVFEKSEDSRRVVFITGASTGLGLALVKVLSQTGKFHVIATARYSSLSRFTDAGVLEG